MANSDAEWTRALARERQRRHYVRKARRQAVHRIIITEERANLLVWEGKINDAEATTMSGIEKGAEKVLAEWEAKLEASISDALGSPRRGSCKHRPVGRGDYHPLFVRHHGPCHSLREIGARLCGYSLARFPVPVADAFPTSRGGTG
jgi:hypothetical protein